MKITRLFTLAFVAIAVLAAACSPVIQPTVAPVPTQTVLIVRTVDSTPRLAIESAFDSELQILLDKTTDKKTYAILGRTYTTGKLNGVDVVLSLSGVSMVNAAMNTQSLLDNFVVKDLIFSGIAGGVNPDLNIGDVVIPKQWAEYQEMTFAREIDGKFTLPAWMQPTLPNFGMMYPGPVSVTRKDGEPDKEESIQWFPVDERLLSYAQGLPTEVQLKKCTNENVCLDQQPILKVGGNGVDGMTFVDNAAFRDWAWSTFKADCLAMETAAVAHVAYVNRVPFLGFRSLSDLAGGGTGENQINTFFQLAANNSAGVVLQFISNYKSGRTATAVPPTVAPVATQGFQIPDIQTGKFNVAVVLIGFHADGGWSQAHTEGAQWMSSQDPTIAVSYIDTVFPGPDAESVMRSLARKGFDLIIGTTFEYGPTMDTLAEEFPKVSWLHVSGYRGNGKNYGNLFGAMENMKYLAGMVAGARAKADNNTKLGYVAPWPLPEVIRLGNAFMLGAKVTCPECTMEVRWINTWYDPDKEKQAAQSLLDAGVDIVLIGSDTPGPLVAAANAGKWAFTYDYINACQPASEKCLGTPYWNWGPVYLNVINQIRAGTWQPGNDYLDADSGIVGFYGFMPGQTPQPGVTKDVIPLVQAKLADMLAGKFTRKDVFMGPIKDNTGKIVVPDGQSLTDEDLQGIDAAIIKSDNLSGRTACTICMNWLADGIQGTIPAMP